MGIEKPAAVLSLLVTFSARFHRKHVQGEFFFVAMKRKLEAVRQQLLDHRLPLFIPGRALSVGHRAEVALVFVEPLRSG